MPSPIPHIARFTAIALGVAATFAATAAAVASLNVWQAESFGDRRLAAPRPDECAIARQVTADIVRSGKSAALRRAAGASDRKLELLAFAWRSPGQRVGPGVDWRDCPGLGRDVRRLGLEHLGSGGLGPALYISRAPPPVAGQPTQIWVTFFAPQTRNPVEVGRDWSGSTTWAVTVATGGARGAITWIEPGPAGAATAD